MARKISKARGGIGRWYATVEGRELPCVHKCFWSGGIYRDPNFKPDAFKWQDLYERLQATKEVIITTDEIVDGQPVARLGYVAVFAVSDVEARDGVLSFVTGDRLCELE